jgi:hypothetical protein
MYSAVYLKPFYSTFVWSWSLLLYLRLQGILQRAINWHFRCKEPLKKKTEHRISVLSLFGWLYLVVAGLSTGYVVMDYVKKVHVRFVHKSLGLSITCWPGDVCLVGKVDFRCSVEWDCSI